MLNFDHLAEFINIPHEDPLLSFMEKLADASSEVEAVNLVCIAAQAALGAEAVGVVLDDRSIFQSSTSYRQKPANSNSLAIIGAPAAVPDIYEIVGPGLRDVALYVAETEWSFTTIAVNVGNIVGIRFRWSRAPTPSEIGALQALGRMASRAVVRMQERSRLTTEVDALTLTADELRHRLKNVYASTSGLAALSMPPENARKFRGRISSLMAVHAMGDLFDGSGSVEVGSHVASLLEPYQKDQDLPIRLSGPVVSLPARMRTPLALIINELATNALKYGALSAEDGRLDITWSMTDEMLAIEWCESGVAEIVGACQANEGSRILKTIVRRQLMGDISQAQTPDGIRILLRFGCPS